MTHSMAELSSSTIRMRMSEAIISAGREIGDPVGDELGRVEAGMRMGRDLEGLLWDIANRVDVPEFRFFIIALSVQRETGGNLAETLNNLSDVLRRRRLIAWLPWTQDHGVGAATPVDNPGERYAMREEVVEALRALK